MCPIVRRPQKGLGETQAHRFVPDQFHWRFLYCVYSSDGVRRPHPIIVVSIASRRLLGTGSRPRTVFGFRFHRLHAREPSMGKEGGLNRCQLVHQVFVSYSWSLFRSAVACKDRVLISIRPFFCFHFFWDVRWVRSDSLNCVYLPKNTCTLKGCYRIVFSDVL